MNKSIHRIFLHIGPGGHPQVDEKLLGHNLFDFWQQPFYEGDGRYLPFLIEETKKKIEYELEKNECVEVIAHSFGAFLLNQQPQRLIKEIKHVSFIAPTFNFFHSLTNLFDYGLKLHGKTALENQLRSLKMNPCSQDFWSFFREFTKFYPDYLKLYFYKGDTYERYRKIADELPDFNETSLINGITELVDEFNIQPPIIKEYNHVTLYLGKSDPLIPMEDQTFLQSYFLSRDYGSNANIHYLEAGHFPHLETSINF